VSDIFISYARPDRPKAERLADAFKAQGWSVWWDREIQLGTEFRRRIADELTSARCVVVLWSEQSVRSRWVQDEANDALERDILIPISLDNARPPLGFRSIQSAELIDWDGTLTFPLFREILANIKAVIRPAHESGWSGRERMSEASRHTAIAQVAPPRGEAPDRHAPVQFDLVEGAVRAAVGKAPGKPLTESDWANVSELDLAYSELNDAGLKHLAGRTGLEHLDLSGNAISDAGLRHLAGLSLLRYLDLSHNSGITDAGLGALREMQRLEHLNLSDTGVSLKGLQVLLGADGLQDLLLRGIRDAAEGLPTLAAFTKLRRLDLGSSSVGDGALPHLERLSHLEYLGLRQTRISDNGKERLKQILARCRVLG